MKQKVICPNLLCKKEIEFEVTGEKDVERVTCSCGTILVVPTTRKANNGTKSA